MAQAPIELLLLLGPGAHEILCVSFKSEVSISSSPFGTPVVKFKTKCSEGLSFQCQNPGLWSLMLGSGFTPMGEPLQYNYFPVLGCPPRGIWDLIIS